MSEIYVKENESLDNALLNFRGFFISGLKAGRLLTAARDFLREILQRTGAVHPAKQKTKKPPFGGTNDKGSS